MKIPRITAPVCIVRDRFILALGGKIRSFGSTEQCEVFDTVANEWFQMTQLPFSVTNSTAMVMNQRFVYLISSSTSLIHTIDTGTDIEFGANGNPSSAV